MRVTSDGNMGIGTSNPDQKLHVQGAARITSLVGTGTGNVVTDADGLLSRGSSLVRGYIPYQKHIYGLSKTDDVFPWSVLVDVKTLLGSEYPDKVTHVTIRILQDVNPVEFPSDHALKSHLFQYPGTMSGWESLVNEDNWVVWLDTYSTSGLSTSEVSFSANVTVPVDKEGLHPDKVDQLLRAHKIKFIYVVPTFQNPAGFTMSLERRKALLKIAKKHRVPIVEDDPYSILRFKGTFVPTLYALARGKGVIYLSTFSKILSPGIRFGFVLAEKEVMKQIVFAKQASDLQTNTFIQYAVYHYCQHGFLEKHIPKIKCRAHAFPDFYRPSRSVGN